MDYPHFSYLLEHRHADWTQERFVEVHATTQLAWDAPAHPFTPLPSKHCVSGTRGLKSSTRDVDTTSHCLVTIGLTSSCAEDLSAHFTLQSQVLML